MPKGIFEIPYPGNEPVLSYAPGSSERALLKNALRKAKSKEVEYPMWIGGKKVKTGDLRPMYPPHETDHLLGHYHYGKKEHVKKAIDAALKAKDSWAATPWQERAAIFLKAADLLAGDKYRFKLNAATMLGQSKNAFQAEVDSACELIDFLRFNAFFMQEVYSIQPDSNPGVWNRMEYRPLEGFIFAVTPFNFTAIAGNLPACPAMLGNTVVWKPSNTQVYSAGVLMELFNEAGLPDGVINLIHTDGPVAGDVVFDHEDFAGIHFTGSTGTFNFMWKTIGENINKYKTYPRIVGETGGKDFVVAHSSADPQVVAVALARGAFEYQGQKCSAASRAYIPKNIWPKVEKSLLKMVAEFKMGPVDDFSNFINAVIDEKSYDNIVSYIKKAKKDKKAKIVAGGNYSKKEGYFIEPTIIVTTDAKYRTMCEEIFGPVLTIHVYDPKNFEKILHTVDETSIYALTGSIISKDRAAIQLASDILKNAAGNFYINDKPSGAVVNQQPFGGARASGTNDKAGSILNLLRWVSPRTIKETFDPPTSYEYPFHQEA